jgi:hypothetical protein
MALKIRLLWPHVYVRLEDGSYICILKLQFCSLVPSNNEILCARNCEVRHICLIVNADLTIGASPRRCYFVNDFVDTAIRSL